MIDHTSSVSPAIESDGPWLAQLRAALQGQLITPDDAGYDGARALFYGGLDRRPALIVRAASAADVAQAVTFARERGLELAVRGGGHSMAGHSATEGGLLLDLGAMKGLEIDVAGRTAWAEAGLTAGEYTAATAAHGLVTGFGDTGSVGIAGITLGGGVGYLVRKHGLTIDDLLAAEIVTADGRLRHVDAATEPELFWAIRGGGGNFGVVTRFKYRLHELDGVYGGMLLLPATPAVIAGFVAAAEAAPEELSAIANVMKAPPMPFLPAEAHGKLVVLAYLVYAGPAEAGERALAPFQALAAPLADMVKPMPYAEIYPPEEGGYHPIATGRTLFSDSIDLAAAETIVDALQASTAMMAVTQIRALGGAMARVPADATAFAHRGARIMVNVAALYPRAEEAPLHEPWVVALADALRKGEEGAYVNFVGDEGEARVRAAYPGDTWARLVAIKTRYDPGNLFRRNHNIPPAAAS
jgi:FAD/FMN-containing dehydrogenase